VVVALVAEVVEPVVVEPEVVVLEVVHSEDLEVQQ
jgi:hypothetical protein